MSDSWARETRSRRYRRRKRSQSLIVAQYLSERGPAGGVFNPPRLAKCTWARGELVGVNGGEGHRAHFSGLTRCGSIHACPVCAAVIRAGRAAEIQSAVIQHAENGGTVLFATLTLAHRRNDALTATLGVLKAALRDLRQDKTWREWTKRLGLVGDIVALEVTDGLHGWHPHLHALLFVDDVTGEEDFDAFQTWLASAWARKVAARGGGKPSNRRDPRTGRVIGADLQRVTGDGTALSGYLAKMQGEHDRRMRKVGHEVARGDFKQGRRGSRTPFELLDTTDPADGARWLEYVAAIKGLQAIRWTPGLRARFAVADRTDEQILEDTETATLRFTVTRETWKCIRTVPTLLAEVLDLVEDDDYAGAEALTRSVLIDGNLVNLITGEVF